MELGWDGDESKTRFRNSISDNSKLEVLAFETGHSFDTYAYIINYVEKYQNRQNGIKALGKESACHIHKGFVHLDIDKALSSVGFQVGKPLMLELAFYDVVLGLLKEKDPGLFNQLFFVSDAKRSGWGLAETESLPLLKMDFTTGVLQYKTLTYDENLGKLKINLPAGTSLSNSDFIKFYNASSLLNKNFESIITNIKNVIVKYTDSIGGSFNTIIAENTNNIYEIMSQKLSFPEPTKWSPIEKEFISKELENELKDLIEKKGIFKNG